VTRSARSRHPRIDVEWELIGAKAGDQPGVHAQAWLLARDDTRFAFTVSVDHSDHIDTTPRCSRAR
jgi:hypothetical protein